MRIISGTHKGQIIHTPNDLNIRPTTDMAKEALFNILQNNFDFQELSILDLFSGSGAISYEFASRGCERITSVEKNYKCSSFIKSASNQFGFTNIKSIKSDVFAFLNTIDEKYNIIFADPPYDHNKLNSIPDIIFKNNLLSEEGWLIIEHPKELSFTNHLRFNNQRKYSKVNFSIFT